MSEPMDLSRRTIGQRIARAARAFEKRQTKHGRIWVVVFMNEDTIVIALHGSLTAAEKAQSQSLAGAARVWEFHRQMFTNASAALFRKIKSITGMEVRDTTAEIDPTTGHVVQIFTTDTVAEDFPVRSSSPAGTRAGTVRSAGRRARPATSASRSTTSPRRFLRGSTWTRSRPGTTTVSSRSPCPRPLRRKPNGSP